MSASGTHARNSLASSPSYSVGPLPQLDNSSSIEPRMALVTSSSLWPRMHGAITELTVRGVKCNTRRVTLNFETPDFKIDRIYSLGSEDDSVEKWLKITARKPGAK